MKNRVDNFLKVTRERVLETEPQEVIWDMNELYNSLKQIVDESGEKDIAEHLESEWHQIWLERKIQKWDEDFLKVIAGEESYEDKLSKPTQILTTSSMIEAASKILTAELSKGITKLEEENPFKLETYSVGFTIEPEGRK